MARIHLHPIGTQLEQVVGEADAEANRAHMGTLDAALGDKLDAVHAGWGQKYVDRVHEKGKLTTWERLEQLIDPGTDVFEVGTLVNWGRDFSGSRRQAPGAGVVTCFARIHGKWCVVIANDNTVASGAWWPQTPEKIERAQEMALRLRIPVIYLIDCSGLFLPEQSRTFPGKTGAGAIFKMNSLLSANGVPQIAGVFGAVTERLLDDQASRVGQVGGGETGRDRTEEIRWQRGVDEPIAPRGARVVEERLAAETQALHLVGRRRCAPTRVSATKSSCPRTSTAPTRSWLRATPGRSGGSSSAPPTRGPSAPWRSPSARLSTVSSWRLRRSAWPRTSPTCPSGMLASPWSPTSTRKRRSEARTRGASSSSRWPPRFAGSRSCSISPAGSKRASASRSAAGGSLPDSRAA